MSTRKIVLLILLMSLVGLSCKIAEEASDVQIPAPTATFTLEPAATSTNTPEPTVDSAATQTAEALNMQQTQTAAVPTATHTPEGPNQSTQQAQSMAAVIEKLAADGVIGSTAGDYFRLPDFDQSIAKIQYVTYWPTEYTAENFVLRADTAWQSASEIANWPDSGCGVVFGLDDAQENFYTAFLALDGYVRLYRWTGGRQTFPAAERFGKVSIPDGDARIMLIVNNNRVKYHVNDQPVLDASATIKPGVIAMTLFSGTNKDFGTRCQMKNIDLWIFD